MSASQDTWAKPLAKRLVDRFRSRAITFVRITPGEYDEETGVIVPSETRIASAGAVVKTMKGEREGVQQANELEVWMDHTTVPWPISTKDQLEYMGRRWKIVSIDPNYSSSETQVYASKVIARAE